MPATPSVLSPQLENHEDRLHRVETHLGGMAVQMATVATKQDNLIDTLEKGFGTLQKSQESFLERLEEVGEKLRAHENRIEDLEREDQDLREKRNRLRTFLVGIVAIGGGVFVTKFAEILWSKL